MKKFRRTNFEDLDRIFQGNTPEADRDLGAFVEEVKTAFSADLEASVEASHLAKIMKEVGLTEPGGLRASATPVVPGQVSEQARWRKTTVKNAFAALALKTLGGAVALMAATGGLAAADLLPDAVQTPVADSVKALTGLDLPGGSDKNKKAKADKARPAHVENTDGNEDGVETDGNLTQKTNEPNENADFGQSVAEDARDGGVDGQEISERARARAALRKAEGQENGLEVIPPTPAAVPGPPAAAGSQTGQANRAEPGWNAPRNGQTGPGARP